MTALDTPPPVRMTRESEAVLLTLDRPSRANALDPSLVEAILEVLDAAEAAPGDMLVIDGAGTGFCGGFDLSSLVEETDASLLHRFVRIEMLLQRIARFPKRTVAYAHGFAWGAGADLLCVCDRRIAAPDCRLSFPGSRFGLVLGTGRLAARVGARSAQALLEAPGPVRAEEAGDLVTDLVSPEDWPAFRTKMICRHPADAGALPLLLARARPLDQDETDMAALVRSAARPGLKERIARYRALTRQSSKEAKTKG